MLLDNVPYYQRDGPSLSLLEECLMVTFNLVQNNFYASQGLTKLLASDCVHITIHFRGMSSCLFSWLVNVGKSCQFGFIKRGPKKQFYRENLFNIMIHEEKCLS